MDKIVEDTAGITIAQTTLIGDILPRQPVAGPKLLPEFFFIVGRVDGGRKIQWRSARENRLPRNAGQSRNPSKGRGFAHHSMGVLRLDKRAHADPLIQGQPIHDNQRDPVVAGVFNVPR